MWRSRIGHLAALAVLAAAVALGAGVERAGAAWPGKNGPIVFAGGELEAGSGLWSVAANGKRLRQLTADPGDGEAQTSPDGRWIVFTRAAGADGDGVPTESHVYVARADGGGVTQVTTGPVYDRTPSFSRSGQRIYFSRFVRASGEKAQDVEHLFSVGRDGAGLRQLTSGPVSDRNPVVSPSGRVVAFDRAGVRPGQGTRHVHAMRPNGSRVVDLTPKLAAWSSQPDFSPAGDRIVFVRGYPGSATADLFTMRPNGKGSSRLTGMAGRPAGHLSNPSYSPDGRFVVAQSTPDERSDSSLDVIRLRDRATVATLGGRRAPRTPSMQDPAWLALGGR